MRIGALYIRVSTDDQTEYSPDAQIRLGLEFAKKNDIIVPKEFIFQDDGISGRKAENRPSFQRMITMAKSEEHPFDVIIVWKFSRFARNQEQAIVYKNLLRKSNVEVVSVSEPIPEGFIGDLVQRIFEWMDEYYSINLSGEVIRGMTERAMDGGYNSSPPLGYKMENGKPVIVPDQADTVRLIFRMFVDDKQSCFDIAKKLNMFGYRTKRNGMFQNRTVKYILQNPFYIGTVVWNKMDHATREIKDKSEWIVKEDCHEALIDKEQFAKAQELLQCHVGKKRKRPTSTYRHWLSGMLICSSCGNRLVKAYTSSAGNVSFQCTGYNHGACSVSHMITESKLKPVIEETLEKVLSGGDVVYTAHVSAPKEDLNQIEGIQKKLSALDQKEMRIKQAYMDGIDTIEEYRQNKEILSRERDSLTQLLETYIKEQSDDSGKDKEILLDKISSAYTIISSPHTSDIQKHDALASVVDNIVYDKPNDTLEFNFYLDK